MHRTILPVLFVASALSVSAAAPVALRWDAETSRPAPVQLDSFRGETLTLQPRLLSYGKPIDLTNATLTLYWQTNAMGQAWWSAPATATEEPGELSATWLPSYDNGAPLYTFFIAAATPAGTAYRAHGTLRMRHSPGWSPSILPPPPTAWVSPADLQAVSNVLRQIIGDTTAYLRRDTTNVTDFHSFAISGESPAIFPSRTWSLTPTGLYYRVHGGFVRYAMGFAATGIELQSGSGPSEQYAAYKSDSIVTQTGSYKLPASTNGGTIATIEDISAGALTAVAGILGASNSWLTVSNGVLSVHAVTSPAAPAAAVWSSAEADDPIPPDVTNAIWQAIGARAPKAWGKYAPDGSLNPDPAYMTMLNAPATMFGSGIQWATAGAYAVLTTPGAAAFAASDKGGELRIGPDISTNYFGYCMGGTYLVGARTDGIKVFNGGTPEGYAELTYDSFGDGKALAIYFTPALSIPWTPIEAIWVDAGEKAVATVAATTATGFYRAMTEVAIDSLFFSTMPAVFEGGVIGDTNAPPVIYDSTITIQVGEKSYRIPAQEIP